MVTSRPDVLAPKPVAVAARLDSPRAPGQLTETLKLLLSKTQGRGPRPWRERDRRATPRVRLELCCEDRTLSPPYFRTTFDLSTFGLSTRGGDGYPEGTRLSLRLHLPDDLRRPLELRAEVVGTHEVSGGMRLAFRGLAPEAVRRIHRYLFGTPGRQVGHA